MYLWFRFIFVFVSALFRSRIPANGKSVISLIVFPNDVDVIRVSNGRYPSYMDLGRIDLLIRQGYFFKAIKKGYYPVVAGQVLRYKRSLRLFQRFEVHSRFLHCGEKWSYLEHKIFHSEKLIAIGIVKGLFSGPAGKLSPQQMFELGNTELDALPNAETLTDLYENLAMSMDPAEG
jgi:acyl-CoA thioesterase FadM